MCTKYEAFDAEGVAVISLNEQPPEHIIQKILEVETLPNPSIDNDFTKGYEWRVNNKYYTASVILYAVHEKKVFDLKFCDKIRATLFYFDGKETSSFDEILSWMPLLKYVSAEVQLLVCERCDWDETSRKKLLDWSVENEFELIEINPSEENEEENDSTILKRKGYGRVIEALQSNVWLNLVMKHDFPDETEQKKEETDGVSKTPSSSQKSDEKNKAEAVDNEEAKLEDQFVQQAFAGEDPDGESFEALFAKFASLKERAAYLVGEEKKKYAEKVVVAFWKAVGGDEDEIAGLEDK